MTPQSMPRLEEVDDMLKQSERIAMSLQRMRDVVFNHHQANIVEPQREAHYRPVNGYDHDSSSNYGDDTKGGGGFAGGDSKTRKRGVSLLLCTVVYTSLIVRSVLPRLEDVTAATEQKPQSGGEVRMELEPSATPVDYVRYYSSCIQSSTNVCKDYAKLTRKMGGKAMASSNLRPKSFDNGSPTS